MNTCRRIRWFRVALVALAGAATLLCGCSGGSNNSAGAGGATAGGSPGSMDDPDAATGSIAGSGGSSAGATSDAGSSSGGTPAAEGGIDLPPGNVDQLLEVVSLACEADCVAIHATECPPANVNRPTCELQCVVQTNYLGEFCLPEYAALVNCRASGGYACVNDFPTPESNCPTEQAAFSACTVDLGCKRYCATARDEGCGGASLDTCIEECIAGRDDFPMGCSYYYDAVRQCQGTTPGTCVDGSLGGAEQCSYSVVSLAECIADETQDLCSGWCYAAETLGCPLAMCETECPAMLVEPTCGTQFSDMVDCGMLFSDVGCVDAMLVGTSICESETMTYQTCLNPPPPPP